MSFYSGGRPWQWGLLSVLLLGSGVPSFANRRPEKTGAADFRNPLATITGSVTNERGEALVGATVKVKGKDIAVATDEKGNFSINADPNSTLVISYTGYEPQEVPVRGQASVNVLLIENAGQLNEVVVTALGIKKQAKELGYSTTQVAGSELTDSRVPNLANALSGQVAGVSVAGTGTGPTGSTRITIRGNTSLTTGSTPLYIIDGVPLDVTNQGPMISKASTC